MRLTRTMMISIPICNDGIGDYKHGLSFLSLALSRLTNDYSKFIVLIFREKTQDANRATDKKITHDMHAFEREYEAKGVKFIFYITELGYSPLRELYKDRCVERIEEEATRIDEIVGQVDQIDIVVEVSYDKLSLMIDTLKPKCLLRIKHFISFSEIGRQQRLVSMKKWAESALPTFKAWASKQPSIPVGEWVEVDGVLRAIMPIGDHRVGFFLKPFTPSGGSTIVQGGNTQDLKEIEFLFMGTRNRELEIWMRLMVPFAHHLFARDKKVLVCGPSLAEIRKANFSRYDLRISQVEELIEGKAWIEFPMFIEDDKKYQHYASYPFYLQENARCFYFVAGDNDFQELLLLARNIEAPVILPITDHRRREVKFRALSESASLLGFNELSKLLEDPTALLSEYEPDLTNTTAIQFKQFADRSLDINDTLFNALKGVNTDDEVQKLLEQRRAASAPAGAYTMRALLSTNLGFFRKLEDEYLTEHRHDDPRLQQEYDKRFGLVLKR